MKRIYTAAFVLGMAFTTFAQISDNMSLLGQWDDNTLPIRADLVYNEIWGYYDSNTGKEYAIIGSLEKVHIIDVTNPPNLTEVASFTGGSNSIWRDMKTFGPYVYCVADEGNEGLMVLDLSDMVAGPQLVSKSNADFNKAHNVFVDEAVGRLYIIGSDTQNDGLIIYDLLSNPAAPVQLASISLQGGYAHDLYVRNNIVYAHHEMTGLYIYDLSDVNSPTILAGLTAYPDKGYNHSSWLTDDGDYLVFCDETFGKGVKVLNVSDLDNLTVADVFRSTLLAPAHTNSIAHNPLVKGNYVYLSYYHDGIQVFDLSDPTDVVRVGYYDTHTNHTDYGGYDGAWGVYPFLPSGNILGSDILNGVFVLSLNAGVLPVEWLAFAVSEQSDGIGLRWSTATETNNAYFEIERSGDGRYFSSVGQVEGANNSVYQQDYAFVDTQPTAGWNYYRLKQVDYDGTFSYSDTRSAFWAVGTYEVFPNPVKVGETISVQLPAQPEKMEVQLVNTAGATSAAALIPAYSSTWQWGLDDLPAGVYTLLVKRAGQLMFSEQIVVKSR